MGSPTRSARGVPELRVGGSGALLQPVQGQKLPRPPRVEVWAAVAVRPEIISEIAVDIVSRRG